MKEQFDQLAEPFNLTDAILTAEDAAAWTLDELDHSADLGSLRSAWSGADDSSF